MVGKIYQHPRFGLVRVIASNLRGRKKDDGIKRQVTVRTRDGGIVHCPWGRWRRVVSHRGRRSRVEGDTKYMEYERDTEDVFVAVTIERRGEHRVEVALEIWNEAKAEIDKMLAALKEPPNEGR